MCLHPVLLSTSFIPGQTHYYFPCFLYADSTGNVRPVKTTAENEDNQTLLLQIESLQAQLEEQTKLAKEQVDALLEDRRVHMEEQQAQRERDTDKIKMMQEKLRKTHDLLYDSTKDFLELKYEIRANERHWMVERDRLVQEIEHLRQQVDVSSESVLEVSGEVFEPRQAQLIAVQSLRHQLEQSQKLAEMYREQCIGLEDELARIRERTDVSEDIFKERAEKMSKRLVLMNSRYESLEKRRALEVEGFKTDIKMLRDKLKNVEKQLFKVRMQEFICRCHKNHCPSQVCICSSLSKSGGQGETRKECCFRRLLYSTLCRGW